MITRNPPESRGIPFRLHKQEWVCTAYWYLYQNRYTFPSYVHGISFGWALLQYSTALPSWQRNWNTWYNTDTPWSRVGMHCLLVFVTIPISTFPSYVHLIFLVERCYNREQHHRPRSAPETRGIPRYSMTQRGYALLSGICMKIDIRISVVCPCNSWRLSTFVIQNSIAVLAAQLKHLV